MLKKIWLPCLLMVTAASPVLGAKEELPDPKKPSFVTGCATSLVKDEITITKRMPEILFCIQKNMDAFSEGKKIPDPKFIGELSKGDVSKVLREDYENGDVLANYLTGIDQLTGKGGSSDVRGAIRSKAKAKASIGSAKDSLEKARDFALRDLITTWGADDSEQTFIARSGITLQPAKRAKYGTKDVSKYAKSPFGPIFFRESKAIDRDVENLGFMLAAMNKLIKNPQDIPNHPKFIKAAAESAKKFWSTKDCYDRLDAKDSTMFDNLS